MQRLLHGQIQRLLPITSFQAPLGPVQCVAGSGAGRFKSKFGVERFCAMRNVLKIGCVCTVFALGFILWAIQPAPVIASAISPSFSTAILPSPVLNLDCEGMSPAKRGQEFGLQACGYSGCPFCTTQELCTYAGQNAVEDNCFDYFYNCESWDAEDYITCVWEGKCQIGRCGACLLPEGCDGETI